MRIVQLSIENVKRITVVQINPEGNLIQITGKNGSGKTSVLDSIYWLLAGTKEIDSQPIRRGASEAIIKADLGDLKVTRILKATGTTLTVERADGTRLDKPQTILDRLIGKIAFDPLEFSRMKAKDQFEQLRKLVKFDIDLAEFDTKNTSDFAKRTELTRQAKDLRSRGTIVIPAGLPNEPIDVSELTSQVERAVQHNADIDKDKAHRRDIAANIGSLLAKAEKNRERAAHIRKTMEEQIAGEIKEADSREKMANDLKNEMDRKQPVAEPVNVDEVKSKITAAVTINNNVKARNDAASLLEEAKKVEGLAQQLTISIEQRTEAKMKAIASAKMPIPGLGFGTDEVMLNELPFDQASGAEQLRASCAIAMAMNPELRVLRITDGSLLDSDSLKLLEGMAATEDFQIWLEKVADDSMVGIVMEDGTARVASPGSEASGGQ